MEWYENLLNTHRNLTIILTTLFLLWILSSIIRNITTILEGVKKGYLSIINFLKWIFSVILLPFKLLIKFLKWIFTTKARHDYKQSVLNSVYNVYPEFFKIPWYRKLFSHRIRREAKTRFRCIEQAIETQDFINENMKFITLIETSVGGGKSSLMAGLTHLKTLHFQSMIQEKIENTRKILYQVNWNKVNDIIEETYKVDTNINNIVKKIQEDEELAKYFHGRYDNYRQETPKAVLLKDYVTACCAALRKNYVVSNYRLLNRITDSFNFKMPSNIFDIKTEKGRENYYIPAYSIITEDELSLSELKNTASPKEIDNSGRDTSMRLIRHLKKETSYYVGSAQDIARNAKIFRELANTCLEIMSLAIIGTQKTFSRTFQKKEQKAERKMLKKKYQDKIPELKQRIYELYQEQNKIYAAGYLKYTVRVAREAKDLERFDKSSLPIKELVIPMTWCFGTYKKCEFNDFDEWLNEKSGRSDSDLEVVTSFDEKIEDKTFEEILKNREEEKKKKEAEEKRKKEEAKKSKKAGAMEQEKI